MAAVAAGTEHAEHQDTTGNQHERRVKRAMCMVCRRPARVCVCAALPSGAVETSTRVILLQAPSEARKQVIGSAPLVRLSLTNCVLHVSAEYSPGMFEELDQLMEQGNGLLAWPGKEAVDLESLPSCDTPRSLLVLDGTWRKARQLWHRNPFLQSLVSSGAVTRVRFASGGESGYKFRREPRPHCLSTAESVAYMLRCLEPDAGGRAATALISTFQKMVASQSEFIDAAHERLGARTPPPVEAKGGRDPRLKDNAALRRDSSGKHRGVPRQWVLVVLSRNHADELIPSVLPGSEEMLCVYDEAQATAAVANIGRVRGQRCVPWTVERLAAELEAHTGPPTPQPNTAEY